ncbi:MAG: phosphate ABC transporter permease subunit PstC [Puniceicoccaceae bacterium]|nr:phosphate ABC transporter permease subunit PstC [Puniceicoccaceae bacterium]
MANTLKQQESPKPTFSQRRALFLGQDLDSIIKKFFGSSAMVAILVLGLITIFLFKEGAGFVQLYHKSLKEYRLSGLEYVDVLKEQRDGYTALTRYLNDVKANWINDLRTEGLSQSEITARVMSPEAKDFFFGYMRAGGELRGFVKKKMDLGIAARDQHTTNENLRETLRNYSEQIAAVSQPDFTFSDADRAKYAMRLQEYSRKNTISNEISEAYGNRAEEIQNGAEIEANDRGNFVVLLKDEYQDIERSIQPLDFSETIVPIKEGQEEYRKLLGRLKDKLTAVVASADAIDFKSAEIDTRIARFKELNESYFNEFDNHLEKLASWDQAKSVSVWQALGAFIGGKDWVTASDQQDWYGLLPLLSGSLLISAIALFFAVPFGVGAAIYVNQIAGSIERNLIKPYIEFVSAIPSVVIGFFGVVVFGEAIRLLSQFDAMQWVPFFPVQERLNAFTAGCLLALMAIPTIFTLAEDAINNVPRHSKEASLAMGATPLQTTMRVIVPTSLSGIISAIMLGFGRVIGETMVVLLCAGNRIKIPDFTEGLGVYFEPVHTMTGIIAQEMGEVVHGSLHYRALFMVGIVLFFISLLINYSAQWVVKRYSKIGD